MGAPLRPSKAVQWLRCEYSLHYLTAPYVDPGSAAARRGTELHKLAAWLYVAAQSIRGAPPKVAGYVRYLRHLRARKWSVEVEVPLAHCPDVYGTADAVSRSPDGDVLILDLKTGQRPVTDFSQLIVYAVCHNAQHPGPQSSYTLRYIQPGDDGEVSPWREQQLLMAEVDDYTDQVQRRVMTFLHLLRVRAGLAKPRELAATPSAVSCQWCEGRLTCPTVTQAVTDMTDWETRS